MELFIYRLQFIQRTRLKFLIVSCTRARSSASQMTKAFTRYAAIREPFRAIMCGFREILNDALSEPPSRENRNSALSIITDQK